MSEHVSEPIETVLGVLLTLGQGLVDLAITVRVVLALDGATD